MKTNNLFVTFLAILIVMLTGFASAELTTGISTAVNDVVLSDGGSTVLAGFTGDTVPVRVAFTAATTTSDVRVKVFVEGYRSDVSASSDRFNIISGSSYSKLLNLELPSDLTSTSKDYTLYVQIVDATNKTEKTYALRMQRESYSLDVLSVDFDSTVSAGSNVPVSIVVKNNGMQDTQDGYALVSIAELGISAKGYFGDLVPYENYSDEYQKDDSVQKTVLLRIPETVTPGVYEMTIKVYDSDATTTLTRTIKVDSSASTTVLASVKNQDIAIGETKTFDMIVVNSGDKIKVYNIQTVSGTDLSVSAPSVITVAAGSSSIVPITVTPSKNAQAGSYTFSAVVDGKQVVFNANVTEGKVSNSVIALTVILVIIFVILLVVLIVLLTRKDKKAEEIETSYY